MSDPRLYHAHHAHHPEDLPFWLALAAQANGPVLELGCGTGRVMRPLVEAGAQVTGIDIDHAMLNFCRANLGSGRGQLIQADIRQFRLARRFARVILPCNTFSLFSAPERLLILGHIARHLQPGGRFVVSIPNPVLLAGLPAASPLQLEETFPHPLDGAPVQVFSGWRRAEGRFTVTWRYDHLLDNGQTERSTVQAAHRIASPAGYRREFQSAGLQLDAIFGGFDEQPFDDESGEMIFCGSLTG